jgi:uncharacterized cupin superfamily protein
MAILISKAAAIPKENLDELGAVKKPLSWPAATLTGKKYLDEAPGIDSMGIWECSPGRWQRTIMQEEFAHFVKGSARFIPARGAPIEIEAGDTIWFPANSAGIWEIREDVRKVYVIIDRPNLWRKFKQSLKAVFESQSGPASPSPQPIATEPERAAEPALAWRAQAEPS